MLGDAGTYLHAAADALQPRVQRTATVGHVLAHLDVGVVIRAPILESGREETSSDVIVDDIGRDTSDKRQLLGGDESGLSHWGHQLTIV